MQSLTCLRPSPHPTIMLFKPSENHFVTVFIIVLIVSIDTSLPFPSPKGDTFPVCSLADKPKQLFTDEQKSAIQSQKEHTEELPRKRSRETPPEKMDGKLSHKLEIWLHPSLSIAQKDEFFAQYLVLNSTHSVCSSSDGVFLRYSERETVAHFPPLKLYPSEHLSSERLTDTETKASSHGSHASCSKIGCLRSSISHAVLRLKEYLEINETEESMSAATSSVEGTTLPWPDGGTATYLSAELGMASGSLVLLPPLVPPQGSGIHLHHDQQEKPKLPASSRKASASSPILEMIKGKSQIGRSLSNLQYGSARQTSVSDLLIPFQHRELLHSSEETSAPIGESDSKDTKNPNPLFHLFNKPVERNGNFEIATDAEYPHTSPDLQEEFSPYEKTIKQSSGGFDPNHNGGKMLEFFLESDYYDDYFEIAIESEDPHQHCSSIANSSRTLCCNSNNHLLDYLHASSELLQCLSFPYLDQSGVQLFTAPPQSQVVSKPYASNDFINFVYKFDSFYRASSSKRGRLCLSTLDIYSQR